MNTITSHEEEQLILDSLDRFLETEVKQHVQQLEHDDIYPTEIVEKMKALGLFGCIIDTEYGGLGLSTSTYAKVISRIAETWMSLSGVINSHLIMASAVQRHGTPEQKAYFLPKFATGELRGGIGLTEPDAGTDLQAIRTVAVRDGDHYVVNGTKTWITNSMYGNTIALLVKTDPNAQPRHKGMSLLIAEKGPGFNVARVEGVGLKQVLAGLELGRINIAARGVGVARAALKEAIAYSQVRKTFGKPICEHQAIQLMLGEMATRVEASRLLVESAAKAFDQGERCDMEAGMAKYFASECAVSNSLDSMRIHGGYGYSKEFNIERYYRDAPLLTIGEGTNELQRMIIAKQLIERNPA